MSDTTVKIYDVTLRDGTQGESISFSIHDKLRIAQKLDELGVHYIEGGWPGSNPTAVQYFEEMQNYDLKHSKLSAFGSTRMFSNPVEKDPNLQALIAAKKVN